LRDKPVVAVVVGVVGGLVIGLSVEAVLRRRTSAPGPDEPSSRGTTDVVVP